MPQRGDVAAAIQDALVQLAPLLVQLKNVVAGQTVTSHALQSGRMHAGSRNGGSSSSNNNSGSSAGGVTSNPTAGIAETADTLSAVGSSAVWRECVAPCPEGQEIIQGSQQLADMHQASIN